MCAYLKPTYMYVCDDDAVLRHTVEIHNDVNAGVGVIDSAHRLHLELLAAAVRNADIHAHHAQILRQERRHVVCVTVPHHVFVAGARLVRIRLAKCAMVDNVDHVQEGLEHGVHVGRRWRPGHARQPARHHVNRYAVRIHRGHNRHV